MVSDDPNERLWHLSGQVFALQAICGMMLRRVAKDDHERATIIGEMQSLVAGVQTAHVEGVSVTPFADELREGFLHCIQQFLGLVESTDSAPPDG